MAFITTRDGDRESLSLYIRTASKADRAAISVPQTRHARRWHSNCVAWERACHDSRDSVDSMGRRYVCSPRMAGSISSASSHLSLFVTVSQQTRSLRFRSAIYEFDQIVCTTPVSFQRVNQHRDVIKSGWKLDCVSAAWVIKYIRKLRSQSVWNRGGDHVDMNGKDVLSEFWNMGLKADGWTLGDLSASGITRDDCLLVRSKARLTGTISPDASRGHTALSAKINALEILASEQHMWPGCECNGQSYMVQNRPRPEPGRTSHWVNKGRSCPIVKTGSRLRILIYLTIWATAPSISLIRMRPGYNWRRGLIVD